MSTFFTYLSIHLQDYYWALSGDLDIDDINDPDDLPPYVISDFKKYDLHKIYQDWVIMLNNYTRAAKINNKYITASTIRGIISYN